MTRDDAAALVRQGAPSLSPADLSAVVSVAMAIRSATLREAVAAIGRANHAPACREILRYLAEDSER